MDYFVSKSALVPAATGIQSSAGAVPVKNSKGEISMQKVKVSRYRNGVRPHYAAESSDEDSEMEIFEKRTLAIDSFSTFDEANDDKHKVKARETEDLRWKRLLRLHQVDSKLAIERHRLIHAPEIIEADEKFTSFCEKTIKLEDPDSSEEEELSDDEVEKRREAMKLRILAKKEEVKEDAFEKTEEPVPESFDESSEYEEYSDYSEEESCPRLKPVFVFKHDRVTVEEKEEETLKQMELQAERKKIAEERRRDTLKMIEESIKKESEEKTNSTESRIEDVCTDDENDEVVLEAWKLRELKRLLRNKEECQVLEAERAEIERLRGLTEEERMKEAQLNPKIITNKAEKGKYKFLQKYYHRGAFYLDKDEDVFKRDVSAATLEDLVANDKSTLPKIMQVKNFGRCGQTKYTHLRDQDTTNFESPWASTSAQSLKFRRDRAAGMKPFFENPSMKRIKGEDR